VPWSAPAAPSVVVLWCSTLEDGSLAPRMRLVAILGSRLVEVAVEAPFWDTVNDWDRWNSPASLGEVVLMVHP
jgi:hypothetical protein